jgi:molecular chaperone GrpE
MIHLSCYNKQEYFYNCKIINDMFKTKQRRLLRSLCSFCTLTLILNYFSIFIKRFRKKMPMPQNSATENDKSSKTATENAADVSADEAKKGGPAQEARKFNSDEEFLAWLETSNGESAATDKAAGETAKSVNAESVNTDKTGAKNESAPNGPGQGGQSGPDGQKEKIAELEAKSDDLAAQLADLHDQLLRKTADFDNFRKRMNQEKQKAIEFANESLLLDIIPIIDDFERAIQSAETSAEITGLPAGKAMLDGIAMIEKQLVGKLENKWGLKRVHSAGEPFDPNIHEAMFMEKSSDIEEPVVHEDFAKGYMLKDRVIRAAKVKVLMPFEAQTGNVGQGSQE